MPRLTIDFTAEDIRLPVLIGPDRSVIAAAIAGGGQVPKALRATALLDTGTNITAISADLIARLGLVKVDDGETQTASGVATVDLFSISLGFPAEKGLTAPAVLVSELKVMALSVEIEGVDVLFGLDALLNCHMLFDGPGLTLLIDF